MSEWTRKLSRQQLEQIQQDTRAKEARYPDGKQEHVHKDIADELKQREYKRGQSGEK